MGAKPRVVGLVTLHHPYEPSADRRPVGAVQTIDRDDDPRRFRRSGGKDQPEKASIDQGSTIHAAISPFDSKKLGHYSIIAPHVNLIIGGLFRVMLGLNVR